MDTLTQSLTPYPGVPEYLRWQYHAPVAEIGYYDYGKARLGRIRPVESGIAAREIDQPGADYGFWCYPEDA